MENYLIFAGTTEGRELTQFLLDMIDRDHRQMHLTVCIATEYGKLMLPEHKALTVLASRLDEQEMEKLMSRNFFDCVLDATHPYAILASENIRNAALAEKLPYIRILRPDNTPAHTDSHIVFVHNMEEAVSYLSETKGNILATTGSKELPSLCRIPDYEERIYARILPNPQMVSDSYDLGFKGQHLICMQGPFSEEMNTALIHQFHISYVLTKNSGANGGFIEKIKSAEQTDTTLVVIGRPAEQTKGYLLEDVICEYESNHSFMGLLTTQSSDVQ